MKNYQKDMEKIGEQMQLSSLQEVFLVNLSAHQEKEREKKITVTSGQSLKELYPNSNQIGLLVKMLLESSLWYNPVTRLKWKVKPTFSKRITLKEYKSMRSMLSKQSAKILKVSDIPSNRLLFQLVPQVHRTKEIEFGLLPTPTAMEPITQDLEKTDRRREKAKQTARNGNGFGMTIAELAQRGLLPTPQATDYKRGLKSENQQSVGRSLGLTGSQVNPQYVAEMMGFPNDWTVLPFLNGDQNQ